MDLQLKRVRGTSCPDGVACPCLYRSSRGTAVLQGDASEGIELAVGQRAVRVPAELIGQTLAQLGADVRALDDGQVVVRGRLVAGADVVGDILLGDGELLIELAPDLSRRVLVGQG